MMRLFLIFILLSMSVTSFGQALRAISEFSKKLDGARIEIVQQKKVSFFDETVSTKAVIFADKNGRIRWQTVAPFESIMIFDGNNVINYEKISDKWRKLDSRVSDKIKNMISQISRMVMGDYSAFDILETGGKILLQPKDSFVRKFMKSVLITPKKDLSGAELIEIVDCDGDKSIIRIIDFSVNPDSLDAAFSTAENFNVNLK